MKDLTFDELCRFVQDKDKTIAGQVSKILDVVLVLSSAVLIPVAGVTPETIGLLASVIEVKNEAADRLVPIALDIFNKIAGKREETPIEKETRMAHAYTLMCYVAFFAALEDKMPKVINSIKLKPSEKYNLTSSVIEKISQHQKKTDDRQQGFSTNIAFNLPHPTDSFGTLEKQLLPVYRKLAQGFQAFLECLTLWEKATEKQRSSILDNLNKVPELAVQHFRSGYYSLAENYNEFFVWASIHSFEQTQNHLSSVEENSEIRFVQIQKEIEKIVDFIGLQNKSIDIGFSQLQILVESLPETVLKAEAKQVVDALTRRYIKAIDDTRIVNDTYERSHEGVPLKFPIRSEIFVPQSFRVIRYKGDTKLEAENSWSAAVRSDLIPFLLSYVSSPYAFHSPLIILGHPGSGKSLLSQFIAARLKLPWITTVRIELRKVNAELKIRDQIVNQINDITGAGIHWTQLTRLLEGKPLLVIFDGYDELLQASGKVFSSYLREIEAFQEDVYQGDNQPVIAMVTSRLTLIDQADVPPGSTVIRLEPFDQNRQLKWIEVWNRVNEPYFTKNNIKAFAIPSRNQKILNLAEQPLLLLMLAIYDSKDNQLQQNVDLSRTKLYDDLLRRFIERELTKDEEVDFVDMEEIEIGMKRLGSVGVSMFNRRRLDITSEALDKDLRYFGLEKTYVEKIGSGGRKLSQGQLLFGSFFFVYTSEALHGGSPAKPTKDEAYEFLHNTFGEFLTADFILRYVVEETANIHAYKTNKQLSSKLFEHLEKIEGHSKEWYAALIYTPLSSRPVILEMIREWLPYYLAAKQISYEDFLQCLNDIVVSQIARVLTKNEFPSQMINKGHQNSFGSLPLIGHLAVYTLNLILVITVLSKDTYLFNEEDFLSSPDGTRPWQRLTFLWRSWFSIENLNEITAILESQQLERQVSLIAKQEFSASLASSKLDRVVNSSRALSDTITTGLSDLLLHDSLSQSINGLTQSMANLEKEDVNNLTIYYLIKFVRYQQLKLDISDDDFEQVVKATQHAINKFGDQNLEATAVLIDELIQLYINFGDREYRRRLMLSRYAFDPFAEIILNNRTLLRAFPRVVVSLLNYEVVSVRDLHSLIVKRIIDEDPDSVHYLIIKEVIKYISHDIVQDNGVELFCLRLTSTYQYWNEDLLLILFRSLRNNTQRNFKEKILSSLMQNQPFFSSIDNWPVILLFEVLKFVRDIRDHSFVELHYMSIHRRFEYDVDRRKFYSPYIIEIASLLSEMHRPFSAYFFDTLLESTRPSLSNILEDNSELSWKLLRIAIKMESTTAFLSWIYNFIKSTVIYSSNESAKLRIDSLPFYVIRDFRKAALMLDDNYIVDAIDDKVDLIKLNRKNN